MKTSEATLVNSSSSLSGKKTRQLKGMKCTTEMPKGHPLLNPYLLLDDHIIAGKGFFYLIFVCLLLPVSAQDVSKLSSQIWSLLYGLCQRVVRLTVVTSPNTFKPYFSMTPTHSTKGSDGNCSRNKWTLGAAAGLLGGLSRREHDTTRLEASPAAGSH